MKLQYKIIFLSMSLLFVNVYLKAQIGINTESPRGIFHVDSKSDTPALGIPTVGLEIDDVLIDVGGYDNAAFRVALVLSDRLVIPTAPRAYDFWALDDVQAVIQLVRPKNPRLQVRVMLSCADTTGSDNAAAMAALQQFDGIEYQATPVTRRKSIAKAAGMGLSVLETKPKDKKAIDEVRGFTSALFAL